MKIFKIIILFLFLITFSLSYYLYIYMVSAHLETEKIFLVKKGESFTSIVDNLREDNIINYVGKYLFLITAKFIYSNNFNVKAGEYQFSSQDTSINILNKLKNGDVFFRKLTIAEGLSNNSIFKLVNKSVGLTGDLSNIDIVEGTLLPETYLYISGESKKEIIFRMQKAMVDFLDKQWENRDKNLPFKTKNEALTLASIVEKETGITTERPLVASVFINRLKNNMRLDSDPTVVYAFTAGNKDLEREIRKSDLQRVSEYNTYIIKGIPPTPIANPGKEAIKAVLNPIESDYLFFVATGNGGHNFSKTLKEHNIFVQEYKNIINSKNN